MAFSYEVYPGLTGLVTDFAVPFGFINRAHVTADVDGVSAPFTWLNDGMIRMDTAPTGNLTITRSTPKTTQVVTFTDGSTQSAELHNLQNLQLLYVTQEAYDTVVNVLGGDGVEWDALGQKIANLATPTDPTDAATKAYVDSVQSAAVSVITAARDAAVASINDEEAAALLAIAADVAAADASATAAAASASTADASADAAAIDASTATTKASEASASAAAAAASATEAANYVPTIASQPEAEAGTDNTKLMTPLRVSQAIDALVPAVVALEAGWLPYDMTDPLNPVSLIYNHGVDGTVALVESPVFEDGYEYLFFFENMSHNSGSNQSLGHQVEWDNGTSTVWGSSFAVGGGTIANTVSISGFVETIGARRETANMKTMSAGLQVSGAGVTAGGVNINNQNATPVGGVPWVSSKMRRIRFLWSAGSNDNGFIRMFKKKVIL